MKRFIFNFFFIFVAVFSGIFAFVVKYDVIEKENKLQEIYNQILDDKREIHMLQAEWMYLNDPQRLRQLVVTQTTLTPVLSDQIISVSDLPVIPAPVPVQKPVWDMNEDKELNNVDS